MNSIIKLLPFSFIFSLVPALLMKKGTELKNKDENATGMDDAAGNFLIALAPAISALADSNENAFRKALRTIQSAIDAYLNPSQPNSSL